MNTETTYKITGNDAVRLSERDQLTLHCHANPLDDGGIVSTEMGRQIARDDANLLWVDVVIDGWWTGSQAVSEMPGYNVSDYFTSGGMYLGPDDDGIEPRWSDSH